jgi:hypothetical protein
MGDKSPHKSTVKKAGKNIKEKRAVKKAKHPEHAPPLVIPRGH